MGPGRDPIAQLVALFPRLTADKFTITSEFTKTYNCVAHAVDDPARWWWPWSDAEIQAHWPKGIDKDRTLIAFVRVFKWLGYERCPDSKPEAGYEKVAIFLDDEMLAAHAARQLQDGKWTSKIGQLEDVSHDLHDLEGREYGTVSLCLRRSWTENQAGVARARSADVEPS